MRKLFFFLAILFPVVCFSQQVTVRLDKPGAPISPYMWGIFYEDINYSGDGGLNADLVQNGSFEYYPFFTTNSPEPVNFHPMFAWETESREGGEGSAYVSANNPLNSNNPHNLEILQNEDKGWFGVRNTGYDGMVVREGQKYDFSAYVSVWKQRLPMRPGGGGGQPGGGQPGGARPAGQPGGQLGGGDVSMMMRRMAVSPATIRVELRNVDDELLDSVEFDNDALDRDWRQIKATLTPSKSCNKASLVILVKGHNLTKLDMVRLIPQDTFKGHGMRKDLAQTVADLHPSFMRFPGGCIIHGGDLENTYHWKETIGDPAQRKNIWSRWGYFQSMAIGYYEYFIFCEDIGAIPLPVLPVGVSCGFEKYEVCPMDELDGPISEVLDLVEFANGPVSSYWGGIRASLGHPEPFGLQYLSLGNEETDTPEFRERYPYFVKALREKYPEIRIIGTSGFGANVPLYDLMIDQKVWSTDEHYYMNPDWFLSQQHRFDNYDRKGPKIFVGEYASYGNTLFHALSEAAFMTGLERNSDIVEMASYAPLLAKYGHTQWERADMIFFDNTSIVKTPNYHVQKLFMDNAGDSYVDNTFTTEDQTLAFSSTFDSKSSELIVKVVNASDTPKTVPITIDGARKVGTKGTGFILTGGKDDINDRTSPDKVSPKALTFKTGKKFTVSAPAYSVQVMRITITK
ncbi:MAG: alpha-N-arabinofuranosidase [Bacteroidales bacterium]|nr:alpha-N-arabinofuranosidase [Bacteroidales bacterium]